MWRGALLLSDFVLAHPKLLQGKTVLELAAGTGLASVVAATLAHAVTATDVSRGEILPLIRKNANLNTSVLAMPHNFSVQELDFFWDSWSPDLEQRVVSSEVFLSFSLLKNNCVISGGAGCRCSLRSTYHRTFLQDTTENSPDHQGDYDLD